MQYKLKTNTFYQDNTSGRSMHSYVYVMVIHTNYIQKICNIFQFRISFVERVYEFVFLSGLLSKNNEF